MAATDYVREQIEASAPSGFSSEKAEQGVICQLLSSNDKALLHAGELNQADFYDPERGKLLAAIQATVAKRQTVDLVTVDNTLGEMFPADHMALTNAMVGCVNAMSLDFTSLDDYIEIVRSLARRRQSIVAFEGILRDLKDPTHDIGEIVDRARTQAADAMESRHAWMSMSDVLVSTYEFLEKRERGEVKGITTGLKAIDKMIGGFFPGELTVIGARPGVGKSAFGANVALEAARKGYRVAVVSREMTDIQYGQRVMSRGSLVDGMKLRKAELDGDDWIKIAEALTEMSALPVSFMFTVSAVEDLRSEVQKKALRGEIDMLVVDYLQLMQTRKQFRDRENLRIGYVCKALKAMAVDFNIPVIALAQVNRDSDGQMPTLKNLKDSGDIEQDADNIIFLHRPSSAGDSCVYPEDRLTFETYTALGYVYQCICVAKQRQGALGKICLLFDPGHMKYTEIDRTERSENHAGTRDGTEAGRADGD